MRWTVEIKAKSEGLAPVTETQEKEGSLSHVVSCLKVSGRQACEIKNTGQTEWTEQSGRRLTISVKRADGFSGFKV